jgi:hypothetical protein
MGRLGEGERPYAGVLNSEFGPVVVPKERDYAAAKDGEGRKQACRSRFRVSGRMLRLLQVPRLKLQGMTIVD